MSAVIMWINRFASELKLSLLATPFDAKMLMKHHYEKLRLIKNGAWAPQLLQLSHVLLPDALTVEDYITLIDEIEQCVTSNPLLSRMLDDFPKHLLDGVNGHGIHDIVAFAMVLERLTKSCAENVSMLDALVEIWRPHTNIMHMIRNYPFVFVCKFYSLLQMRPLRDAIKGKQVVYGLLQFMVNLNIFEAICYDVYKAQYNNAYAGWALLKACPKLSIFVESETLGYPTIHAESSSPKEWADLYTVWNLCFLSNFPLFPYYVVKLLIPSVSGYSNRPTTYLYFRAIALFITLHFRIFHTEDDTRTPLMEWWEAKQADFFSFFSTKTRTSACSLPK